MNAITADDLWQSRKRLRPINHMCSRTRALVPRFGSDVSAEPCDCNESAPSQGDRDNYCSRPPFSSWCLQIIEMIFPRDRSVPSILSNRPEKSHQPDDCSENVVCGFRSDQSSIDITKTACAPITKPTFRCQEVSRNKGPAPPPPDFIVFFRGFQVAAANLATKRKSHFPNVGWNNQIAQHHRHHYV